MTGCYDFLWKVSDLLEGGLAALARGLALSWRCATKGSAHHRTRDIVSGLEEQLVARGYAVLGNSPPGMPLFAVRRLVGRQLRGERGFLSKLASLQP